MNLTDNYDAHPETNAELLLDNASEVKSSQIDQQHFVEDVGLLFETVGFPRMAGRVFGWLLLSNPPHQSPGELAEVLQASKGSISTMTRLLEQLGLIERVSLPGQRRDYFRIKLNAWSELSKRRMDQITAFRKLAERGLTLLAEETPELTQRLREMYDIHAFFEAEIPLMLDRWERYRATQTPSNS
ncbi:MAG: MarR family transcriptional regulator [Leptolyngbyaceae cyanobacterium bins.302]|nr:MarR family transcriptional regulator [Leptolyngbyaceae cyanobacterium bins.302]